MMKDLHYVSKGFYALLFLTGILFTSYTTNAQTCLSTQTFYASGNGLEGEFTMCRTGGDAANNPNCTWTLTYSVENINSPVFISVIQSYFIRVSANGGNSWTILGCGTLFAFPEEGETVTGSFPLITGCNQPNFVIEFVPTIFLLCPLGDFGNSLSTGNVILPIRFDNVNLRSFGTGNEVSWNVAVGNETVSHFEIQYSPNGENFTTIGKQVGNQAARNTAYAYQDLAVRDKGFYRIKVVETNGAEYFSQVLFNNNSNSSSFRIFPNPAVSQIFIEKPAHQNRASEISIFSVDGRQVLATRLQGNSVDVSRLPNGQYILVVRDDEQTVYREKFIIAK